MRISFGISAAMGFTLAATATLAADPAPVPYPTGYRDWRHVKSMVIEKGHPLHAMFGGIHHLYANQAAVQGYKSGKFPDGSVIVFDLLTAKRAGNTVTEGERKIVGVMVKNRREYSTTGGWGFEGFKGNSKTARAVGAKAATACFTCHTARRDSGYVFSTMRR